MPGRDRRGHDEQRVVRFKRRVVRWTASCLFCIAVPATGVAQTAPLPAGDTVVFGGDHSYPPLQWIEQGEPHGFLVELSDAIAAHHGARVEHHLSTWPAAVRALASGDVDVVAMFESTSRERDFIFVAPFMLTHHAIYARDDHPGVDSIKALDDAAVIVEELSFAFDQLTASGSGARILAARDTLGALRRLDAGEADYALLAVLPAQRLIEQHGLAVRAVGPPQWPRSYGFAVRNDNPELAAWLEEGLNALFESGEYQALQARWSPQLGTTAQPPTWLWSLVAGGLVLVFGFAVAFGWVRNLRRTVLTYSSRVESVAAEREAADSHTQWVRDHDVYTELPRLHRFVDRLDELRSASPDRGWAVVALRVVELEETVRAFGHEAGIAMASETAERLRAMQFDAYGQSGRDVFLVAGDPAFVELKLRMPGSPSDTIVLPIGGLPNLTAGCAVSEPDTDSRELVRRAETALGHGERRHERWTRYRPAFDPGESDLQLVRLFRDTAGEGVFAVFQPQVDIRTGEVIGAEALARWNAPGIGIVPPSRFIPLLEEAGLIRYVTKHMIAESVRVGAELRRAGFDCPISVNVAVSDLLSDGTRRTIFRMLREYGAEPECLKLELTETSFAESAETVRWVMIRLRESGLRISIDDFGTGFSSLSYLSEFPIDEVKIDRSFVDGIETKQRTRSIVRSTIAMAHELGLIVVAEGIETDAAMRVLASDGCDRGQGYLISHPLAEQDLLPYLETARERSARMRKG